MYESRTTLDGWRTITLAAAADLAESDGQLIPGEALWEHLENRRIDPGRMVAQAPMFFNILRNITEVKAELILERAAEHRRARSLTRVA